MKKHITAIDNVIDNNLNVTWDDLGFNRRFGDAYAESIEAENDIPDFAYVIWDEDIDGIIEDCKKTGIDEFTISSTFSGLLTIIAKFQERGCVLQGLVEINSRYDRDYRTGERKRIPALLIKVCK